MRLGLFCLLLILSFSACSSPWAENDRVQEPTGTGIMEPTIRSSATATANGSSAVMPDSKVTTSPTTELAASPTVATTTPSIAPNPTDPQVLASYPPGCHEKSGMAPSAPIPFCATTTFENLPGTCTVENVASLVARFQDAFNRGDVDTAMALFPETPGWGSANPQHFQWFRASETNAEGGDEHGVVWNPVELPAFLGELHAPGERFELRSLRVNLASGAVGIAFEITRQANDRPAKTDAGKGAVSCGAEQQIYVWVM